MLGRPRPPQHEATIEAGGDAAAPAQPAAAAAAAAASSAAAAASSAAAAAALRARAAAFVVTNFLPLGFALALLVALTWPLPGRTLGAYELQGVKALQAANNACVFLVSGLTLNAAELRAAAADWRAPAAGVLAILGATPCLGFAVLRLPLQPHEFAVGLAILAVVPTTLGVGVALTAAAKGNQVLALALTVTTNLLGIATVPYFLRAVLASMPGGALVRLDANDLAVKLVFTVLVPTCVGQAAKRASPRVARWVAAHRTALSLFSHCNLVCIVWQTLSAASAVLLRQRPGDVIAVAAVAAGLHIGLLALMHIVFTRLLQLPPRERVALVIMSAQKSAPVAVAVITYITRSSVQQGLFAIPALLGQITQIFVGSALARMLAKQVQRHEEAQEQAGEHARDSTRGAAGGTVPLLLRRLWGRRGDAAAASAAGDEEHAAPAEDSPQEQHSQRGELQLWEAAASTPVEPSQPARFLRPAAA